MTKFYSKSSRIQVAQVRRGTSFMSQVGRGYHETRRGPTGAPPGPTIPAGASFYAPLQSDTTELVANYPSIFARNSDGWYWDGSAYQVAGPNVARFESDWMLREPDITNLCANYNANPDAALANMTKGGDAASVLSRVSDASALASAGLGNICSSGFVFQLDNSSGSAVAFVDVTGGTAASMHVASAFVNKVSGAGASTIGFSAGTITAPISSTSYERTSAAGITAVDETLRITAGIGDTVRFVVNQMEAVPVPTSPIITQGASASRPLDDLKYGDLYSYFDVNVATVLWQIKMVSNLLAEVRNTTGNQYFDMRASTPVNLMSNWYASGTTAQTIFFNSSSSPAISVTNTRDGSVERQAYVNEATLGLNGYLWINSTKYKATAAYAPNNTNVPELIPGLIAGAIGPFHIKDVIIYKEGKDEAWLDANWLCDGCFPA